MANRVEDVDMGLFNPVYGWFGEQGDDYEKHVRNNSNPNFVDTKHQKLGIPIDGNALIKPPGKDGGDRVTESLNKLWGDED